MSASNLRRSTPLESTPLEAGYRMPAEWELHARCSMAWPHREDLRGDALSQTEVACARVARAIASSEPVTTIAAPTAVAEAAHQRGSAVNTFALEIDDAGTRDTGPALLRAAAQFPGRRVVQLDVRDIDIATDIAAGGSHCITQQ